MLSRRRFLKAGVAAGVGVGWPAGLLAAACQSAARLPGATSSTTTTPSTTSPSTTSPSTTTPSTTSPSTTTPSNTTPIGQPPFDTVIVVMLENRSFDHLLGWLPGADGRQAGLAYRDLAGRLHPTHDLGQNFTGCGNSDPDHSWPGGQIQLNGGRNDGWLLTPPQRETADIYPIGYYADSTLPVLAALARNYTTLDGYFCSLMSETYPNRIYMNAATTDRDHNLDAPGFGDPPNKLATIPTIWDRLAEAGVSHRYYFNDAPFIALWGLKYLPIISPFSGFLADAAAGKLPHVSFVDPTMNNDHNLESDQHPFADVRLGDQFLADVFHAVRTSPQWSRTVLIVTYDEWGGFFDHVPPPKVIDDTDPATVDHRCGTDGCGGTPDYHQLGFRVPCIVISPFSASGPVHGGPYEHCSILRMIEWRWHLRPLTARDANARNLVDVLDFGHQNVVPASAIPTPASFVAAQCR
jgi:phospholipase C